MLVTFSHNVFYPSIKNFIFFFFGHIYSLVCNCFWLRQVPNVVVWWRVNPIPNKPWFLRVCSTSLSKALWEKKKLLVTSNFSYSQSVFYPIEELFTIFIEFKIVVCKLFQFGRAKNLSFGKGLNWRHSQRTYYIQQKWWQLSVKM